VTTFTVVVTGITGVGGIVWPGSALTISASGSGQVGSIWTGRTVGGTGLDDGVVIGTGGSLIDTHVLGWVTVLSVVTVVVFGTDRTFSSLGSRTSMTGFTMWVTSFTGTSLDISIETIWTWGDTGVSIKIVTFFTSDTMSSVFRTGGTREVTWVTGSVGGISEESFWARLDTLSFIEEMMFITVDTSVVGVVNTVSTGGVTWFAFSFWGFDGVVGFWALFGTSIVDQVSWSITSSTRIRSLSITGGTSSMTSFTTGVTWAGRRVLRSIETRSTGIKTLTEMEVSVRWATNTLVSISSTTG
jgi:hypothetical protein